MAYVTGSANGAQPVFDATVSAMTANSWTVVDTLSTGDKVLHSTGTSGKENLYCRVTLTTDTGNPVKSGIQRWRNGVILRGYLTWDSINHTGTQRYGRWGPFLECGVSGVNTRIRLNEDHSKYPTVFNYATSGLSIGTSYYGQGQFGGYGQWFSVNNSNGTSFRQIDITTQEILTLPAPPDATFGWSFTYVMAQDGTESLYWGNATNANFYRYDIASKTFNYLGPQPWGGGTSLGWMFWDGNDTIYALRGFSTTSFYKYSISGGTWTALTSSPASRTWGGPNCPQVYIPAASNSTGSDVILTALSSNSSTLYLYNINTDTWSTVSAPFTTGTSGGQYRDFTFDKTRWIYFVGTATSTVYKLDALSLGTTPTFTNLGSVSDTANKSGGDLMYDLTSICYTSNLSQTVYHIVVTPDNLVLSTHENDSGADHWASLGLYDSYHNTNKMVTTGSITAGYSASIPVDDSSKYSVGDVVNIVDGTNGEQVTILSIPDSTHIVANVKLNHASGVYVGFDVAPYVCAGDNSMASTPFDARGYLTDQMNASWRLSPSTWGTGFSVTTPSAHSDVVFSQLVIWQNAMGGIAHNSLLGTLRNVYVVQAGQTGSPASQQIISASGKNYVALIPKSQYPYNPSSQLASQVILIGPIN